MDEQPLSESLLSIISDLPARLDPVNDDTRVEAEKIVEAFRKATDKYQESPELLDQHLTDVIAYLTSNFSDSNISANRFHTTFKLLYQLIKVVGFKHITKRFPHEADKLPMIVELLSQEDTHDRSNWQTRFALTVWLSIAILTPFDLKKFDPTNSLSERILNILCKGLEIHDSCQQVTAYCLAKFLSRPDVHGVHLDSFVNVCMDKLSNIKSGRAGSGQDDISLIGHLRTLAYMFEYVAREHMKQRCDKILSVVGKVDIREINRELVNHIIIKCAQRCGLAFLPSKMSAWRRKRGARALGKLAEASADESAGEQEREDENEEESSSAERVEAVLSMLFVAAQDTQTRIRWSAAKGIARITNRLSRERATQVVDMVLGSFFDVKSNEFAWHGGCLALAEISRHGSVADEKIAEVLRVIGDAIVYDRIKGSFAIGAHVREAACYVCWAMARTYEDAILEPHIDELSTQLLCTMLFDRELQCRRAASATFQELIGRQGAFSEDKMLILTSVDYHNVGQRHVTYSQLACQVARLDSKYSLAFVHHLLNLKIAHWDIAIRRLAAECVASLMLHVDALEVVDQVLAKLVQMIEQNDDVNAKHGAILGLAQCMRSLVPLEHKFSEQIVQSIGSLRQKCDKQLKSKPLVVNFTEAICQAIVSADVARLQYADTSDTVRQWDALASGALDSDNAELREAGAEALYTLYKTYYAHNKTCQDAILAKLNRALASPNESSRCGALCALAKLGRLPALSGACAQQQPGVVQTDADTPDIILTSLVTYIGKATREPAPNDHVFAQAKADACDAFARFVKALDVSRLICMSQMLGAGLDAMLEKTLDFTFDKRGDIGVVVRRAAIRALLELTLHLESIGMRSVLRAEDRLATLCARVLQQAVSYNNSTRELAACAFYKLVTSIESDIPHRNKILQVLRDNNAGSDDVVETCNWRDESTPIFVRLLTCREYCRDLWAGLVPAIGQPSEMGAKRFREALRAFLIELSEQQQQQEFEFVLSELLETLASEDRLVVPGLIAADYLLTEGVLCTASSEFQNRLADLCWQKRDKQSLRVTLSAVRVLCALLQFDEMQPKCQEYCAAFLANPTAKVRTYAAEQLQASALIYDVQIDEKLAKIVEGELCGKPGAAS